MRTLYVGRALAGVGGVDTTHRAVLVEGDLISWTGPDPRSAPPHQQTFDLGEAWLTPGFVDAHVHATATGLQRLGLDMSGARSAAALLEQVATRARTSDAQVVQGAGWDDLGWPEGRPPTADELAAAAPGRTVVLTRIDGHSCLVDRETLDGLDLSGVDPAHVHRTEDGQPSGWLLESASTLAQDVMRDRLLPSDFTRARDATCQAALALGITELHEMGVPGLSTREDALTWATGPWPLTVKAYWAEMGLDPDGILLPGGDLFLDGSIGSCTAATVEPYRTNEDTSSTGMLFHADADVAAFFAAATRAGLGAGVHAIGDAAVAQAVRAIRMAADQVGLDAVRAVRHRIEHVELVGRDHIVEMADLGVVASLQPAFDAVWNGPGGLYEHRFGRDRADGSNPFGLFADAGVAMCFSSDSTVTPLDPWGGIHAAENHHGGHAIDRVTALHAATVGGHHVVGEDQQVGALSPGMRADLVAWPGDPCTEDPDGWIPGAVVAKGRLHGA